MAARNDAFALSLEQESAVNAATNQLCILACAGSGKTTTLTRRIARLINDNGVNPSKVAAITFTVLAGDNLKYELSRVLKDQSATARMFVGTIHSFCFNLLISEKILSAEAFEPITESQQFILLAKNWLAWEMQKVAPTLEKSSIIERLMASFDIIKMNCISLDKLREVHPEIARTYELYNKYLYENGFLDYADMLTKVRQLLLTDKPALSRCIDRFPYIFIDEYQDVDPVQAEIANILKRATEICVVGDDDQAIYQFRGADERNIQAFSESAGCTTTPLSENRRCPKNILAISESNISKVKKRLPKSMYTNTHGGLISIHQFPEIKDELAYIVATIQQLVSTKAVTSYGQIGILLRSMASYGSIYVNALKAAGIPCISRGARTLFSTPEIGKIVAIIEWFSKDSATTEHLKVLSPLFSVPINTEMFPDIDASLLTELHFKAAGLSSSDWLLFNHLQNIRVKYEERKFGSLLDLIHRFIEELDLFNPEGNSSVRYNVAQFTRIIGEYEKIEDNKSFRSLAAFLSAYARNSYDEVSPTNMRADTVNILTIHQSKGLEFDFVFIPMLVEDRFPLERSTKRWLIDDTLFDSARYKNALDNERRLFYVACTRARKALYLLASEEIGLKKNKHPSRFWIEAKQTPIPDNNQVPVRAAKERTDRHYLVSGYSSLEYYLTCPYRYELIVEYGLEFPQAVFFQFGKLMHDLLAMINSAALSGHPLTIDQAKSYLEQSFALYYKNTNMRQYDIRKQQLRALQAIDTYYKKQMEWMNNLVGIEGNLAYATNHALIKGRYDALIRNKRGKHTIIDYKTGQPHAGLRTDFQMQFYCLAVDAQLHIEVDEAIVYYVEADKSNIFSVTTNFLNDGEEKLTNTINGIIEKEFLPKPNKNICPQCEARKLCSYKAS